MHRSKILLPALLVYATLLLPGWQDPPRPPPDDAAAPAAPVQSAVTNAPDGKKAEGETGGTVSKPGPNFRSAKEDEEFSGESIWQYFSAGILVNKYFGDEGDQPIAEAVVRSGKVRVTKKRDVVLGLGLQAHYAFALSTIVRQEAEGDPWKKWSEHGLGPYVGVMLDSDDVIDALAVGLAYSHRRQSEGVRIGVGLVMDPDAKHLDGVKEGDALAEGEVEVPTQERLAWGIQVMVAFTPGF